MIVKRDVGNSYAHYIPSHSPFVYIHSCFSLDLYGKLSPSLGMRPLWTIFDRLLPARSFAASFKFGCPSLVMMHMLDCLASSALAHDSFLKSWPKQSCLFARSGSSSLGYSVRRGWKSRFLPPRARFIDPRIKMGPNAAHAGV